MTIAVIYSLQNRHRGRAPKALACMLPCAPKASYPAFETVLEIQHSHSGVLEDSSLLGCYVVSFDI